MRDRYVTWFIYLFVYFRYYCIIMGGLPTREIDALLVDPRSVHVNRSAAQSLACSESVQPEMQELCALHGIHQLVRTHYFLPY